MKLQTLYKGKCCPCRPSAYWCDGRRCAKFVSCMMDEIDALHVIGAINNVEVDELDCELIKWVR